MAWVPDSLGVAGQERPNFEFRILKGDGLRGWFAVTFGIRHSLFEIQHFSEESLESWPALTVADHRTVRPR